MINSRTDKIGLIEAKPVGLNDTASVLEVISSAFNSNPVWCWVWAFPEH